MTDVRDWIVLVVDDEQDNLGVANVALTFYGATVYTAQNGLEGIEVMHKFTPSLILLDLSMPEMDGWEMLKQLKVNPLWEYIPVIAVTAHVLEEDRKRVQEAGFDGYIPKPFRIANLVSSIQAVLRERHFNR